jgi:hypothetical protein
VEHLGLEPSSISLQGRYAGPARAPIGFALGGQTLRLRVQRSDGEKGGSDPANGVTVVPGVGFEPTSPRLQRGAFTRLASQAIEVGAADENRTRVCAVAPHGSPIELRTRAQSRTRTCGARRHLIYSQASLPLEYLCVNGGAGGS